jgi:hypothetical protein
VRAVIVSRTSQPWHCNHDADGEPQAVGQTSICTYGLLMFASIETSIRTVTISSSSSTSFGWCRAPTLGLPLLILSRLLPWRVLGFLLHPLLRCEGRRIVLGGRCWWVAWHLLRLCRLLGLYWRWSCSFLVEWARRFYAVPYLLVGIHLRDAAVRVSRLQHLHRLLLIRRIQR